MIAENDLRARMDLVPLGSWLDIAREADVPYIKAWWSEPFPLADLHCAAAGECNVPDLDRALKWLEDQAATFEANGERFSARWECCSSSDNKHALAQGKPWGRHNWRLSVDDPHVFDCTVGCETTRIAIRPWVEPIRIGGYPVEFRAFVDPHGVVVGVSDYYPQRNGALVGNRFALGWAAKSGLLANMMRARREFVVGFTADFIVSESGDLLFIDGGPPHATDGFVSAHPCCFAPGQISGIVLEPQPGALTH